MGYFEVLAWAPGLTSHLVDSLGKALHIAAGDARDRDTAILCSVDGVLCG